MKRKLLDNYHIRDAREMLSIFPANKFVDATITSPPYWNLKNYKSRNQIGFGQGYEEYLRTLEKVFASVYAVTKNTGSLWVIVDTIKHKGELRLLPFDLARKLRRVGWVLQDIVVWHKDKTLPWSHRGKLRNIFEYILFFSKGNRFKYHLSQVRSNEGLKDWWIRYPERYSPGGKAPSRTWRIAIPRQGSWGDNWVRHFCPLPPELAKRIILLTTRKGDVVLDPFAGSGVVLAQARAMERRYVGFDLRESYRKMFERRVLPSIVALENKGLQERRGKDEKRRAFSALIWKLRKTKYPRELLRNYEKQFGRTQIIGTMATSRGAHSLEIVFLLRDKKNPSRYFLPRIQEIMKRPPFSKYGLKVSVTARALRQQSSSESKKSHAQNNPLSLYTNGVTYMVQDQITSQKFIHGLRNGLGRNGNRLPPIVSNITVNARKDQTG